jgi:hypothetical protein
MSKIRSTEKGLHLESRARPLRQGAVPEMAGPPKFSRKALDKAIAGLVPHVLQFKGAVLEDIITRSLCVALLGAAGMPPDRCPVLEVSMWPWSGAVLDRKTLIRICMYFNANRHYILAGETIPRWGGSPPQWMVVAVADWKYIRIKDRLVMNLRCPVLTGVMAGRDLLLDLPPGYVRWLLKEIGCPKYSKISEKEISGMTMQVRAGVTGSNHVGALKVEASSGMKQSNRELHRARREDHCTQYSHACYDCRKGRDECPLACRSRTIITGEEDGAGKTVS